MLKPRVVIGLNAVIVTVTAEMPRILTVKAAEHSLAVGHQGHRTSLRNQGGAPFDALPLGPLDAAGDRTLELGLRRWVREQTGLGLGYVEQLYTFGDSNREPLESVGGSRVVSVAYLALVREDKPLMVKSARWMEWYWFFPWEDWRSGRPAAIDRAIAPALAHWVASAPDRATRTERRERADIAFGLRGAPWDGERVLERYELLYEAGLALEAWRDRGQEAGRPTTTHKAGRHLPPVPQVRYLGQPMALDHRRILATALSRLRGKLKYRPVVFELLSPTFTLLQLQRVVEALAGVRLHKQNLRRLVEKAGLVEGTGRYDEQTGGRPAELFRFRRDVLHERPSPGVGLPGRRQSSGG